MHYLELLLKPLLQARLDQIWIAHKAETCAQAGGKYDSAADVQRALKEQQRRKAERESAHYECRYGAQDQAMTKALDRCLKVS